MPDFKVTQTKSGRPIGYRGTAKAPDKPVEDAFTKWHKKKYKTPPGIADRSRRYKEYEEDKKKQGGWGDTKP